MLKEAYRKRDTLTDFLGAGMTGFYRAIAFDTKTKEEALTYTLETNIQFRLLQATFPTNQRVQGAAKSLWDLAIESSGKSSAEKYAIGDRSQVYVTELFLVRVELNELIEEKAK